MCTTSQIGLDLEAKGYVKTFPKNLDIAYGRIVSCRFLDFTMKKLDYKCLTNNQHPCRGY